MGGILTILTSRIGIVGIAVILLGGLWFYHSQQMKSAQEKYDALNLTITDPMTGYIARLATVRINLAACTAVIEDSNKRVEEAKAEADKRVAAANLELAPLRARLLAAQRRVTRTPVPVPKPGETACDTAARLIDEELAK
jgi:hypothetical protein